MARLAYKHCVLLPTERLTIVATTIIDIERAFNIPAIDALRTAENIIESVWNSL